MVKKSMAGESGRLIRTFGQAEVFFTHSAHNVFLLQLEGDMLTVSTRSLPAFDTHLDHGIRMLGSTGVLAGRMLSLMVRGQNVVDMSSDGPPMPLERPSNRPSLTHRRRSAGRQIFSRRSKSALQDGPRYGSGEVFRLAFQPVFHCPGFMVVQPSKGQPVATSP